MRVYGGMAGPTGNGASMHGAIFDRFEAEDVARRAWLDVHAKERPPSGVHEVRLGGRAPCPICGGRKAHRPECLRSAASRRESARRDREARAAAVRARLAGESVGKPCRCGHFPDQHRGIVCHGIASDGFRCRCDKGCAS